jgi:uncharacterized protein (TIGR01244 family)
MADIRTLNESISVAPQILPGDLPAIAAAGFKAVVNNRPDDEEPGQPAGDAVRAAAEAAGLAYTAIPVGREGIGPDQLDRMTAALVEAGGPVLAFCRSGTRSCHLWALAAARAGRNPELIQMQAGRAGYDLTPLRPTLDRLASDA